MTSRGWWRRNAWGLGTVLPLFAVLLGFGYRDYVVNILPAMPREPVHGTDAGGTAFGPARWYLTGVRSVPEVQRTFGNSAVQVPDHLRIWQVVIEVTPAADSKAAISCDLALFDTAGRRYSEPDELAAAALPSFPCSLNDDSPRSPQGAHEVVDYFVLPAQATPDTVRVTVREELPRYLVFAVPG